MVQYLPPGADSRGLRSLSLWRDDSASPLIASVLFYPTVLLDSSSSLLFSLLLAQLPVFTSASPVPQRRPTDMDKLSNQTKNLMKLTQELLVSEDVVMVIANLSYWLEERLMRPWLSCANWIVSVRVEEDAQPVLIDLSLIGFWS